MKEADVPAQKVGEDERGSHGVSAAENPIDLSYRSYITSERTVRQQDSFTSRSNAALPSDIAGRNAEKWHWDDAGELTPI